MLEAGVNMFDGANWKAVGQIVEQIHTEEKASHFVSGLVLCFICIDTMANLSRPASQAVQTRAEFTAWVDKYLRGHQDQPYTYRGIDVYAARCAVLHAYGSEAAMHRSDQNIKMFAYHDGGKHMIDPKGDQRLVIIGLLSFLNDVRIAVGSFVSECEKDSELRELVESRLGGLLTHLPIAEFLNGRVAK